MNNRLVASINTVDYVFDVNGISDPEKIKSFDARGLTPPPFNYNDERVDWYPRIYLNEPEDGLYYRGSYGIGGYLLKSTNDETWFVKFGFNTFHIIVTPEPAKYFIMGKVSIDDSGNLEIDNYSNNELSFDPAHGVRNSLEMSNIAYFETDSHIYIIRYNGYIVINKIFDESGPEISSVGRLMPEEFHNLSLAPSCSEIFFYENYLYWMYDKSIKRMQLSANSVEEIIYSEPGIVNVANNIPPLLLSGNQLIFSESLGEGIINTYFLSISDLKKEPTLLSTNIEDIKDIIELNF